jgi:hypothetical protein
MGIRNLKLKRISIHSIFFKLSKKLYCIVLIINKNAQIRLKEYIDILMDNTK